MTDQADSARLDGDDGDRQRAAQRAAERWGADPDNTGYSPNRFFTRATDGHGHSQHIKIRFPPDVMDRMEEMLATRELPFYRTTADLIRDSVVHRLAWLAEEADDETLAETIRSLVARLVMENTMDQYLAETEQFRRANEKLEQIYQEGNHIRDHRALRQLLMTLRAQSEGFRPELGEQLTSRIDRYIDALPPLP